MFQRLMVRSERLKSSSTTVETMACSLPSMYIFNIFEAQKEKKCMLLLGKLSVSPLGECLLYVTFPSIQLCKLLKFFWQL